MGLGAGYSSRPLLVLSDDPDRAVRAVQAGDATRRVVSVPLFLSNNHSFGDLDDSRLLVLEIELANRAANFVGVACSTVSQLIVKQRQARAKPFHLWP